MIYITGDTHGDFTRIEYFCQRMKTTKDDIMIILGDAGINYYTDSRSDRLKTFLEKLPITLFCIHGNHEERPFNIPTYKKVMWHGAEVYQEEEYPSLLFAIDGNIYDIDGKQTLVLGGAYSVDKEYRLAHHYNWFPDEQPSDEIKAYAEQNLKEHNWAVDVVLSHTTPYSARPVHMFLTGIDQSKVDSSTELWLEDISHKLTYKKWYAGHYHCDWSIDKVQIMFENIEDYCQSLCPEKFL